MFDPEDSNWDMHGEEPNYWDNNETIEVRPPTSIAELRDSALNLFEAYLCNRLNVKPRLAEETLEHRRQFLSEDETESIVKEFSTPAGLPEGVYGIGARSIEELQTKTRQLMNMLLARIMSNVAQYGVNAGLLDCAFDDEHDAFAFSPSQKGEELIEKMLGEKKSKKKKKKKKDDTED